MKIETTEDLENVISAQNTLIISQGELITSLGQLVRQMDADLKLQQEVNAKFQRMFDAHGWTPVTTVTSKRSESHFDA